MGEEIELVSKIAGEVVGAVAGVLVDSQAG
jgi:hypothetical protein